MAHQMSPPPSRPQYPQQASPVQPAQPAPPGQPGHANPTGHPVQSAQPGYPAHPAQPGQQGQTPQQPMNRPYSPYLNAQSQSPGPAMALPPPPPNKRPRLSPNPSSPQTMQYASPDAHYHSTPYANTPYRQNSPYNNPYSPVAAPSPPPFNAPQPFVPSPVAGGAMGPPPRPNADKPEKEEKEKIHDISDVTDVFHGSGIDLREEENYMSNTFRNTHASTSFGSSTTVPSPNNSFNYLNQPGHRDHPAFSGSGPISQETVKQENIEEEIENKHNAAARALATARQQHLKDSFLVSNRIRHRMHQIAYEQGVALNVEGLFDKIEQPSYQNLTQFGPNGEAIAAIKEPNSNILQEKPKDGYLQESAPLADILTLVSVAANERLRTLVDDAYRLARGRRYGSHGVVPPDFTDIANGEDPKATNSQVDAVNGSSWESSRKRDSDGNVKPEVNTKSPSPAPTISFSESLSKHLVNLAIQDREAEKERVRKREERAKRAAAAANNEDGPVNIPPDVPATSAAATPSAAVTPMPDAASQIAPEKPLTKKERERQAKLGQTEEVLHKNANVTAAMALGGGKKKKKYSWMTGGAAAAPSNPYKAAPKAAASPTANGPSTGKSPAGSTDTGVDKALQVRERKWGGWREDGIEGRGIQIRDWVQVLERDGREKKALQKALLRLDLNGPDSAAPNGHPGTPGQ